MVAELPRMPVVLSPHRGMRDSSRRGKALVSCLAGDVPHGKGEWWRSSPCVRKIHRKFEFLRKLCEAVASIPPCWNDPCGFLLPRCFPKLTHFGSKICWLFWTSSCPAGRAARWLLCMPWQGIVWIWGTLHYIAFDTLTRVKHSPGLQPFRLTRAWRVPVLAPLAAHMLPKGLGNALLKVELLWKRRNFIQWQRVWGKHSCRM